MLHLQVSGADRLLCQLKKFFLPLSHSSLNQTTRKTETKMKRKEYMFLQGGKFMPGMEKLAGELFFPTNQQLFLRPQGVKTVGFREKKSSSASFFLPGINFSAYRIHFPVLTLLDLTSDQRFILPHRFCLITWPIGRPPAERPGIPKGWNPFGHNVTNF